MTSTDHPAGSAEVALEVLGSAETALNRAWRVAELARHEDVSMQGRIDILGRLMRIEPRVARRTALELAGDSPQPLREVAAGILSITLGSEDDLSLLLSLRSREAEPVIRRSFERAIESVNSPTVTDSIRLLATLVHRDIEPASEHTLLPFPENRSMFHRWVSKTWCREAGLDIGLYSVAVLTLMEIMIDTVVVAAGSGPNSGPLPREEVEALRHGLYGRRTHRALTADPELRARWPWMALYSDAADRFPARQKVVRRSTALLDSQQIGDALTEFGSSWVDEMAALADTR